MGKCTEMSVVGKLEAKSFFSKSSSRKGVSKIYVRRGFYQSVIKIDGRCMNIECPGPNEGLQVHHIIFRSHGGLDHLCNGITLCTRCHSRVHRGFTDPATMRVTGRSFMITIQEELRSAPVWRWDVAYQYMLR